MLENLELGLFALATTLYLVAWGWHLRGWKLASAAQNRIAIRILSAGFLLHFLMVGLRWYRAEHVPMLSAFEFVTFLENGAIFRHTSKTIFTCRLAGNPVTLLLFVFHVELRVRMPGNPDGTSRNVLDATECDKQG